MADDKKRAAASRRSGSARRSGSTRRGGSSGRGSSARRGQGAQRPTRTSGSRASGPQGKRGTRSQGTRRQGKAAPRGSGAGRQPARKRRVRGVGSTLVKDRFRLSERMKAKTRRELFLESSVADFLLVLVVASAMVLTLSFGFHSAWELRGNPFLAAALCAPLLIAMYLGAWSKKMVLPSALVTIVMAAIEVGVAMAISPDPLVSDEGLVDTEGNYVRYVFVVIVVSVVCFLLSRRPVGLVVLLVLVIFFCGLIQFMYREWTTTEPGLAVSIVALLGIGMLLVYQCYKQSVYSANRVKRTSFFGAFAFSLIIGVACVLVGAIGFYGVVAVSNLTTPDIRLFTEYNSPPTVDSQSDIEDSTSTGSNTSSNDNDEPDENESPSAGGGITLEDVAGALEGTAVADLAMMIAGFDPDDPDQDYEDIAYLVVALAAIILAVLLVALVVGFILFWRYRRKLRLKRISKFSNAYQAWYLYTFLLGRFARLKMRKRPSLTPLEYAVGASKAMVPFTRGTEGVSFVEVTALYQDVAFGTYQPSDDELERVKRYYLAFFKNARKKVGWVRWVLWKFWRI